MAASSSSSSLIHFPNLTTTRVSHSSRHLSLQYKPQLSSSAAGASSLSYQSKRTSRRNLKAIEKGKEENSATTKFENVEGGEELKKEALEAEDKLGAEIREAMKVKKEEEEKENVNYWDGVIEEIKEIEWPVFSKVLGTTGVVIGVIAGSSVVLLTVNALLAEFSDQVFAGRGVQDFFG
ncbi:preprotein translocase subunit SECE1-like [Papaver somniferum]|uniref:preprotein translocase subunit SECE1-like n=1 Tax=Papaver somniferum TaxID=3469 RepID=UPI000E7039BC|nr:preprotein translocase subunit SECE1-like [Papaver somniferum]